MGVPVGKRQFHAFLSHAHVDKSRADQIVRWLRDIAAVPVWYDAVNLPPGAIIEEVLPEAIANSRAMLLLLSHESVARGWVQHEYRAAINHQTQHRRFRIIPVRLDDVSPPGFLQNYSNVSLGQDGIDLEAAAGILKGLYQPDMSIDTTTGRNVYVSRGWHLDDATLAEGVGAALRDAGLQLIGDAEDQPSWVEARITGIMRGCGAYTAVLPYRPASSHKTSKYILREWELATGLGLPCLVIADPRIDLPPDLADRTEQVRTTPGGATDPEPLAAAVAALAEDWTMPARPPYVFFATDFAAEGEGLRRAAKELVEAVTSLPCVLGEYVKGKVVQREILRSVSEASLVLADISGNSPNVYIEVGAARAAEVPVFLLRQGPPGRPAFMLRDLQVWDYATGPDLLGRITQMSYPYRRTLLHPHRL